MWIQPNRVVEIGQRVLIIALAQIGVAARIVCVGGFRIQLDGLVQFDERFRKVLGLSECASPRFVFLGGFRGLGRLNWSGRRNWRWRGRYRFWIERYRFWIGRWSRCGRGRRLDFGSNVRWGRSRYGSFGFVQTRLGFSEYLGGLFI